MSCEIESPSGSCLPFNREIPATETRKLPTPDSLHSKEGKAKRLSGEGIRFIQVSELQCIEMTVQSILIQQFIVGSILNDLFAFDHQYAISVLYCYVSVYNDECMNSLDYFIGSLHHLYFAYFFDSCEHIV